MSQEPRELIKMEEDLFKNLPTEIMMDIFLRLPIQGIIMCKIVCKSWRESVGSIEFAKSHLSKATPHLVVFLGKSSPIPYKMVEFVDEHRSAHRCNIVSNLSFPSPGPILGSVNGLLFWCNVDNCSRDIFVCNPITREYINLPRPPKLTSNCISAGVGVCKKSGQYKIVRILHVYYKHSKFSQIEFQLHTVGSGSWRRFLTGTQSSYSSTSVGVFLNGNLHWLVDSDTATCVSCFDLETELLTSFSFPMWFGHYNQGTLSVVGGRLCFCISIYSATEIWFMNEYGDDKSWTKELIIKEYCCTRDRVLYGWLFPIKVFINGDILIARGSNSEIFCYSKTTDAIHNTGIHERDSSTSHYFNTSLVIYTPTFVPLRSLLMVTENVCSF